MIELNTANLTLNSFLDTKSFCTLIKDSVAQSIRSAGNYKYKGCDLNATSVTITQIVTKGMLTLPIKIGLKVLYQNFIIVATDSFSWILSTDILKRLYNVAFQFDQNSASLNNMQFSFLSIYSNFDYNYMLNNTLQCTNNTSNVNIMPQCTSIMSMPVSFPERTEYYLKS